MTTHNVGQGSPSLQPALQAAQPHAQPGAAASQGGSDAPTSVPLVAPHFSTLDRMKTARRWLMADPSKVPHYVNGKRRQGQLDGPDDLANMASYDEAKAALGCRGSDWLLGFALGPDGDGGYWQGVDFDDVPINGLADIANLAPGYVEISPSGRGQHALGYGRAFGTLGPNKSGLEAYAVDRYFTVTEWPVRDSGPMCLAQFVEHIVAPRHGTWRPDALTDIEVVTVDAKTVSELRSALDHMPSDDRDLWVNVGHALKELGQTGRGLWLTWSQTSGKYDPKDAAKKWDSFKPTRTGYQMVFKEAQKQGWLNPASKAAHLAPSTQGAASTDSRKLVGRPLGGVQMRSIDWLWTGWVPKGYVTLFAGETGAGKSTVLADITARVTTGAPWPGEFSTVPREPGRVLWLGSEDSIEEMTVPRLTACGADLNNVIEIQGVSQQGKRNTFSMQDDLESVSEWLKFAHDDGRPFAMLVIDPVTSYLPGQKLRKVDLNDAGQLRTILEPWLTLAQQHNIAIVCVTHFAKDTTRAMLHRVLGSAAFAQTCRSLCAVIQRPTPRDEEPEPHAKALVQVKVNLPEHPGGAWKFSTQKVEVGVDARNGRIITATRPHWEELDGALTPESMVGGKRGPVSTYEAAFGMWVKAYFITHPAGQWLRVDQVRNAAVAARVVTDRWWNEHSGQYLDKQNDGGFWFCRPRQGPGETT